MSKNLNFTKYCLFESFNHVSCKTHSQFANYRQILLQANAYSFIQLGPFALKFWETYSFLEHVTDVLYLSPVWKVRVLNNHQKVGYISKQRTSNSRNSNGWDTLKKYSTYLAIRKMQIRTTLRFHLTPVRIAEIRNTNDSLFWRGCGVRTIFFHG